MRLPVRAGLLVSQTVGLIFCDGDSGKRFPKQRSAETQRTAQGCCSSLSWASSDGLG